MDVSSRTRLYSCEGLVVVITGGGTGIGYVMARTLEANGATVYIIGRRRQVLDAAATASCFGRIIPVQGDVTSKEDLQMAADYISTNTGYVNLVIANSGVIGTNNTDELSIKGDKLPSLPVIQDALWKSTTKDFSEVYEVNVTGTVFTTIAFLDLLDRGNKAANVQQTSQILITSSMAAFDRGHTHWQRLGLAYTASKTALNHLTKSLSSYLIHYRIRVNAIAPGTFKSELTNLLFGDIDISSTGAFSRSEQPLERAGKDDEVAGTVLYYASAAGAYCSGSIHLIDGGTLSTLGGASY